MTFTTALNIAHCTPVPIAWLLSQTEPNPTDLANALPTFRHLAHRVEEAMRTDPFTALVLSHDAQAILRSHAARDFADMPLRHEWRNLYDVFNRAQVNANTRPELGAKLARYLRCRETIWRYAQWLGNDPDGFVHGHWMSLNAAKKLTDRRRKEIRTNLALAAASFCILILAAARDLEPVGVLATLGLLIWLVLALVSFMHWLGARANERKAQKTYDSLEHVHQMAHAFVAHPEGGGFLVRLTHEHPLLFQAPVARTATFEVRHSVGDLGFERALAELEGAMRDLGSGFASRNRAPAERVVERQIVVTRCKFCRGMTPVDASTCQHCGAPGFGG